MNFKRKVFMTLMVIIFLLTISITSFASEPQIGSTAAILVEQSTGKILYEKNAYEKMYPASTTKIMTAILTLENCDLNDKATVSRNSIYSLPTGYVNANLHEGEEMYIKDLMYALMVKSANDAAIVLAEHIGESVEGFAEMMNSKAKELGCTNTNFVNPNGIHNENHYSTAHDLYLIADYCMKNETFRKYVSTVSYTLPATNKYPNNDRLCLTTNELLRPKSKYYNKDVIGIKTGHTTEAKNCLISAAQKNGIELISVVLHGGTNSDGLNERYVDTNNLFKYGFDDFKFTDIVKESDIIKNLVIENGTEETKNLDLISKETITDYLNIEKNIDEPTITLNEEIRAPIKQDTVLGKAVYKIDDKEYTINLLASHDVDKKMDTEIIILSGAFLIFLLGIILLRKTKKKNKR